jgi:DNA replicative helicase MCM subunit Mcm2 (Cdc46/Mcm family)
VQRVQRVTQEFRGKEVRGVTKVKINCPECKREVNVEYDEDDTRWKGNCVECKLSLSCSDPVVEMRTLRTQDKKQSMRLVSVKR